MKKLNASLFVFVCLLVILYSCKSTQTTNTRQNDSSEVVDRGYDHALDKDVASSGQTIKHNENNPSNLSLTDMLRKQSGVTVSGSGSGASIRIGGINSFGPTDPLFVVNGTQITNFAQVFGIVNPNEVTSITVLKGNDAAIYGSRGGNGVIVIRTK